MATTHTWNGASNKYIFDPTQYLDGTAFATGDTLVVNGGDPTIGSTSSTVANLITGTYQFTVTGSLANLGTDNIALHSVSTMAVTGPGTFQWFMYDQFVNSGAIQVGSAAGLGTADIVMATVSPATLTNQGTIAVQNGSLFKLQTSTSAGTFVNAAGAVLSISRGSLLASGSYYGYSDSGAGDLNTTNNGLIEVTGATGRVTKR